MSLINDALKRASGKPPERSDLPAAAPIMNPAPDEPRSNLPLIIAGVAVLLVLVLAVVLLRAKSPTQQAATAPQPVNVETLQPQQPAASVPDAPPSNPVQRSADVLNKVAARNEEGAAVADSMTTARTPATIPSEVKPAAPAATQVQATPAAPVETPASAAAGSNEPKVQAIFFRMKDPTAIVNGKTVRVGDTLDGALKIVAINRHSVDIELDGKPASLTIK